ncbi:MAG: hypothetical protein HEQ38_03050 [Gemmatimonas sp.]|nr:hypothetical protein [Gemmatimonas sp.]
MNGNMLPVVCTLATALTLFTGTSAAHAQSKAQAAMYVKAENSVALAQLRDVTGEPIPFGFVANVAILSNGSVLVADQYEQRIVLTDSTGRYVAAAGRNGSGPGEFQSRARLMRLRGDTIGVDDATLRRMSIFDQKLKFVRTEVPVELATSKGWNAVQGQFADGSYVMRHAPMPNFAAPDGVRNVQHIVYVSDKGRTLRQMNLPVTRELQVATGNGRTMLKVPMTTTRGLAVCENGFVIVADNMVDVYDTRFTLLHKPPYRGRVDTLSSAYRKQMIDSYSSGYGNAASSRKIVDAMNAAQPRQIVRYSSVIVSADGLLWFSVGDEAAGRFIRTTVRGEVLDTLYAPYQILHADKRISVASGPYPEGEEAPAVIVRQKAPEPRRKALQPSPLGRCNSVISY